MPDLYLFVGKDNANECNENLFSDCRVQLILCKDSLFFSRSKKMHRNFITNRENTAIVRKFYKISAEKLTYFRKKIPWPNISQNTAF